MSSQYRHSSFPRNTTPSVYESFQQVNPGLPKVGKKQNLAQLLRNRQNQQPAIANQRPIQQNFYPEEEKILSPQKYPKQQDVMEFRNEESKEKHSARMAQEHGISGSQESSPKTIESQDYIWSQFAPERDQVNYFKNRDLYDRINNGTYSNQPPYGEQENYRGFQFPPRLRSKMDSGRRDDWQQQPTKAELASARKSLYSDDAELNMVSSRGSDLRPPYKARPELNCVEGVCDYIDRNVQHGFLDKLKLQLPKLQNDGDYNRLLPRELGFEEGGQYQKGPFNMSEFQERSSDFAPNTIVSFGDNQGTGHMGIMRPPSERNPGVPRMRSHWTQPSDENPYPAKFGKYLAIDVANQFRQSRPESIPDTFYISNRFVK